MAKLSAAVSFLALLALGKPHTDFAAKPDRLPKQHGFDASAFQPIDEDIIGSEGYLSAHPDQRFRLLGMEARKHGRYEAARRHFRQAAHYADKLSQGALAEMYWEGEGGEINRVLAYIWMDLAAERGAPSLLAHRERYWAQMTAEERVMAVAQGPAIYAEYGDGVAKPRLERILSVARRRVTGSRVGWVGKISICIDPSAGSCGATVMGEQYYSDSLLEAKEILGMAEPNTLDAAT